MKLTNLKISKTEDDSDILELEFIPDDGEMTLKVTNDGTTISVTFATVDEDDD